MMAHILPTDGPFVQTIEKKLRTWHFVYRVDHHGRRIPEVFQMLKALIPLSIVLMFLARTAESAPQPRAERSNEDPQGDVAFLKAIEIAKKSMKAELKRLIDSVDQAKLDLRKSVIADDAAGIKASKGKIAKLQSELRDLVDANFPPLDFERLQSGQIGTRTRGKEGFIGTRRPPDIKGQDLVYSFQKQGTTKEFVVYVVGMEGKWRKSAQLEIWVDDDTMLFVAVGEVDVGYYEGNKKFSERKAFEIRGCRLDEILSQDELKAAAAATEDFTVTLTDSEKETQKKAIERNAAEKVNIDKEAKVKRAQGLVEMGKSFLKSNNKEAARKRFEKAILEAPDSNAAKEAKKLLEE
jgi:hypothetical protein